MQALKTGYTREAGYNLAVEAYRSGERFLLVVLGANSRSNSFRDAHALLRFGYAALGLEAAPAVVKARPTTASVKKPVHRRPVRAKIRPAR